jgi:hypothetical protein
MATAGERNQLNRRDAEDAERKREIEKRFYDDPRKYR